MKHQNLVDLLLILELLVFHCSSSLWLSWCCYKLGDSTQLHFLFNKCGACR